MFEEMFGGAEPLGTGMKVAIIIIFIFMMFFVAIMVQLTVAAMTFADPMILNITALMLTGFTIYSSYLIATRM